MRMRRRSALVHSEETGIDLAPMLDFVLNLLIFFIITAVFVKEIGLTVSRPNATNAEKKEAGNILVVIRPGGEICDRRDASSTCARCAPTSSACMRSGPTMRWSWSADKGAHTGVLVQVIDQVRQGGVQNVSIAGDRRASVMSVIERSPSHAIQTSRQRESEETGIDLAPMLDFVLNLLIFFIITTSFVKEAGITVNKPEALTAEHKDNGNILIAIRPNGDIWMDKRQVDITRSRGRSIERLHVERPEDTVVHHRGQGVRDRRAHQGHGPGEAGRRQPKCPSPLRRWPGDDDDGSACRPTFQSPVDDPDTLAIAFGAARCRRCCSRCMHTHVSRSRRASCVDKSRDPADHRFRAPASATREVETMQRRKPPPPPPQPPPPPSKMRVAAGVVQQGIDWPWRCPTLNLSAA